VKGGQEKFRPFRMLTIVQLLLVHQRFWCVHLTKFGNISYPAPCHRLFVC
jgi:hypothetical protein